MRQKLKRGIVFVLVMAFVLTAVPAVSVGAHEGHDHGDNAASADRDQTKPTSEELRAYLEGRKQRRQQQFIETRLDDARKRACEKRKDNITGIMERSIKRAEEHAALFDSIANRTKAFYEKKGNVLANYDELVAAVNTAEAKVDSDIAAIKIIEPFDCAGHDVKGVIDDFKTARKTLTSDLKEYRTAVKNLIVGVKSAQGQERSNQ